MAAEAVRDQDHRPARPLDRKIELVDPDIAIRIVPHAELDPGAIELLVLPPGLPVARAAIAKPGHEQDQRLGVMAQ